MGNSQAVARKHYLQITDAHFAKAVTGQCGKIVASSASQEAANEKCDALETAQTSMVSQSVASSVVVDQQITECAVPDQFRATTK